MELSITTTRSGPLRRISALAFVLACLFSVNVLAKETPEQKAERIDEKAAAKYPITTKSNWQVRKRDGTLIRP